MPKCCDCEKDVPKSGFAKSQLKKKPAERRCKECAGAREARKSERAAEKKEAAGGGGEGEGGGGGGHGRKEKKKPHGGKKENGDKKPHHGRKEPAPATPPPPAEAKGGDDAAKAEAEEKANHEAEKAKKAAEEKATREAEKAKREAEKEAKKEAEKAKKAAEEKARKEKETAEKAKKEAEKAEKAKRAAEEKAKKDKEAAERKAAEEKAKAEKEAAEKAKREAEAAEKARKAAEEKARKEAEKARKAEEKAKREAEAKAKREAEQAEKAKREAEKKAKEEAERAKKAAEEKAKKEKEEAERKAAEELAKAEAEAKAKAEAEAKAKAEAEAKAKAEAEAKAKEEAAKAKKAAEEKAAAEAKAAAEKAEAEAKAKAEAEAEAKAKAEAEAEAKAKAEAEAKAKAEADAKAKAVAEAKAKAEAEAKAKAEAEAKAKAEAEAAEARAKAAAAPPPQSDPSAALPPGLEASLPLLTPSQRDLASKLCSSPANQSHLFAGWSADPSSDADAKRAFMAKLETVDRTYPSGGLLGYVSNARDLLDKSRRGVNPLEGWTPSVPAGRNFDLGTEDFVETEKVGREELGRCGFVLVAGGLGERLGYGGIKIGLPTELATETCYAQYYIETILAYQQKYAPPGTKLPLCIMTSGDTNAKTVDLLERNKYFGMEKEQVTIVQQGEGVPALTDNDARIAVDPSDPYKLPFKPHGHGDVHALIHSEGVAKKWLKDGVRWAVFFQDTNGLAFHTLALSLGVSVELGLVMNSTAVPRKAKQAIGGIARLTSEEGEHRTINVEYNQLDPLLRATGRPDGDANDEETGHSPFPGNINQLLFDLGPYAAALDRTRGAMPEFVNPKYSDSARTVFKKPTRLECMMQDFPTVLTGSDAERVGFTSAPAELCFSPVKNSTADGAALQAEGTHPGVAASGEADQYGAARRILAAAGCRVEEASPETYGGVTVVPGPEVVLKPSFVSCPGECGEKFPAPEKVKISARSSLVVEGSGLAIESLDLDGALVIRCEEGASGVIRDLEVKNRGWEKVADRSGESEVIAMRGYRLNKIETRTIVFKKDGSVEGGYAVPAAGDGAAPEANARSLPSLTEPAHEEVKETTNFCGGGCVIL